jgi:hypothetical protein
MNSAANVVSGGSCIPHDGKCSIVQLARKTLPGGSYKLLIYKGLLAFRKLAHSVQYPW